jgi:C4-dicarboxylate-specific signal transduction histidine kinase
MFRKDQQQQRDLSNPNAISDYWLKVSSTTRCTCWIRRRGDELEYRRPADQGLRARRNHRAALFPLLYRSRPRQRQAAPRPAHCPEQGRYEEEGWRVRKDGTFFWASVIIDPIYEDGNLVGFAKITRDITERREAQLKLEQMHQQLAESQKLDALGQLTGGVAHDFNNLLMIISGSLHTLKKAVGDDPRSQRALSAIDAATKRGASLTSQLLTFARRQSVNPQIVDVAERIDAVREVLDTAVGSAVTLQFDLDPGVWPVMVDVAEFETGAGQSRHQRARRHGRRRRHHDIGA